MLTISIGIVYRQASFHSSRQRIDHHQAARGDSSPISQDTATG